MFSLRPPGFFGLVALFVGHAVFRLRLGTIRRLPPCFACRRQRWSARGAALPLHSPLGLVRPGFFLAGSRRQHPFLEQPAGAKLCCTPGLKTDRVVGPLGLGVAVSGAASILVHRGAATICCGGSGVLLALCRRQLCLHRVVCGRRVASSRACFCLDQAFSGGRLGGSRWRTGGGDFVAGASSGYRVARGLVVFRCWTAWRFWALLPVRSAPGCRAPTAACRARRAVPLNARPAVLRRRARPS